MEKKAPKIVPDLTATLELLNPREQQIIRMRLGLIDGGPPMTFAAIGHEFAVSRMRIWQIYERAMRKLTNPELLGGRT